MTRERQTRPRQHSGRLRAGVLSAGLLLALTAGGCSSGIRNCQSHIDMARRDMSSGSPIGVVQGVVMYSVSPIACGFALVMSPITEIGSGGSRRARSSPTPQIAAEPAPPLPEPTPEPSQGRLIEVEKIAPLEPSTGTLEKVE